MNRTVVCIIAGLLVTMGCRREVPPSPEEQMTALRETVVALHEEGDGASGRELLKVRAGFVGNSLMTQIFINTLLVKLTL